MVKAQLSHLFICEKHNSQMYVYVQKWESLKVYLKLLNLRLLDSQGCNNCGCFLSCHRFRPRMGGKGVGE